MFDQDERDERREEACPAEDDDAFIVDRGAGPYRIYCDGRTIGTAGDLDVAAGMLAQTFEAGHYFPPIWFVNDHGNMEEAYIGEHGELAFTGRGWV